MVLRAVGTDGKSRASRLAEAIVYAANNGAQVINLSVGGKTLSRTEELAIRYAHSRGAVVVAAAGNEAVDLAGYGPAASPEALAVAATNVHDERMVMSNWGSHIAIAAPGVDVLGPRAVGTDLMAKFTDIHYKPGSNIVGKHGHYYRATGTSFSAPIVSGIASLLLSRDPKLSNVQVERMLLQSADDIGVPGFDRYSGYGLVNARAALMADPSFFIDARIDGVALGGTKTEPVVEVRGTATADHFERAWVEIGVGENPKSWKVASPGIRRSVAKGVVGRIDTSLLRGATQFTLRLVVEHQNGRRREARFTLNTD